MRQLAQRRGRRELFGVEQIPLTPRGRRPRRSTSISRVGVAITSTRMSSRSDAVCLDHLHVMHGSNHRGLVICETEVVNIPTRDRKSRDLCGSAHHPPRLPRRCHHEVEAALAGDLLERDRPGRNAPMPVEPGCIKSSPPVPSRARRRGSRGKCRSRHDERLFSTSIRRRSSTRQFPA